MTNFETSLLKKKRTLTTIATMYPLAFAMAAASRSRGSLMLKRFARASLDAPRITKARLPEVQINDSDPFIRTI